VRKIIIEVGEVLEGKIEKYLGSGERDVELEIGPGYDPFILRMAEIFPEKDFLAIEIDPERIKYQEELIKRRGIENVKLICGDAKFLLPNMFKSDFFSNIYILFPDPWPKKRHKKNRLLDRDFLLQLFYFLKLEGTLLMATDNKDYAFEVFSLLHGIKHITFYFRMGDEKGVEHKTKFEKIFLKKGIDIFYFRCSKEEEFNGEYEKELKCILERERVKPVNPFEKLYFSHPFISFDHLFNSFKEFVVRRKDGKIFKYKDLYISQDGNMLILEGICREKRLVQNLSFQIGCKRGRYEVALFTNRDVIFTEGVIEFIEIFMSTFLLDFKL